MDSMSYFIRNVVASIPDDAGEDDANGIIMIQSDVFQNSFNLYTAADLKWAPAAASCVWKFVGS